SAVKSPRSSILDQTSPSSPQHRRVRYRRTRLGRDGRPEKGGRNGIRPLRRHVRASDLISSTAASLRAIRSEPDRIRRSPGQIEGLLPRIPRAIPFVHAITMPPLATWPRTITLAAAKRQRGADRLKKGTRRGGLAAPWPRVLQTIRIVPGDTRGGRVDC